MCVCVRACVRACVRVRACVCLTLNYHSFNLNSMYLHVTSMVCVKANFPLQDNKVLFLSHLILAYITRE